MGHYTEWEAYIGPPWKPDSDPAFWDWSSIDAGAAWSPTPSDTTLASTLSPGATTAALASVTGWPTAGSAWIFGNGSGEAVERIDYTGISGSDLTGLARETIDSEQTGTHTAGAVVRFWWQLDTAAGRFTLSQSMDDTLTSTSWTAAIEGVKIPQAAIRNHNLVVIRARWWDPVGEIMGPWAVLCLGWMDSPTDEDNADRIARWRVNILDLSNRIGTAEAAGVRIGNMDAAANASANASSTLAAARKEASSGDFSGEPDFSAGNTTDGDSDTLWIAERYLGGDNTPANPGNSYDGTAGQRLISQIHMNPYTGQGNGYRWIEITYLQAITTGGDWIVASDGYYADIEDLAVSVEAGDHIILAENPDLFTEENPDHDAVEIVDLASYGLWSGADGPTQTDEGTDATAIFDHLAIAGGSLRLYHGPTAQGHSQMVWGSGSRSTPWAPEWHDNGGSASSNVTAPGPGETMRYIYAPTSPTEAADYWTTGNIATPGYTIATGGKAWILWSLDRMGLTLGADIDSSQTTGIYIHDPAGATGDGLPDSGAVQVGQEQISYTSLARTTGELGGTVTRGASGTTAASHSENDPIYFVESGTATDAYAVDEIEITLSANIVAEDFAIRASRLTSARTPEETNYLSDYYAIAGGAVTGNAATSYTWTLSPAQRIRHLLLEITKMDTVPARPRLVAVRIDQDADTYGATTLATATAGQTITTILDQAGIPTGGYTDAGDTVTVDDHTTGQASIRSVLQDLADFSGSRIHSERDSKLSISLDPFWSITGVPGADHAWTRSTLQRFERINRAGPVIGQIDLVWRTPDNSASGRVQYPATRDPAGQVITVGPYVTANEAAAQNLAQKRYYMERFPKAAIAEIADEARTVEAGEIHQVTWDLDDEMQSLIRQYIVASVDHAIEDHAWATALTWWQVGREDDR